MLACAHRSSHGPPVPARRGAPPCSFRRASRGGEAGTARVAPRGANDAEQLRAAPAVARRAGGGVVVVDGPARVDGVGKVQPGGRHRRLVALEPLEPAVAVRCSGEGSEDASLAKDADYLPLMRQGSSRLSGLVRSDEGENRLQAAANAGRGYVQDLASGSSRYGAGLAIVAALLVVLGARDLFTGPIPAIREFVDAGTSASALLAQWWSGWREAGMGEATVAPGVVPGLGALGTVLLGSIGLARRLLVLAPLFLGALGAWKLLVQTGSIRARAGMLAAYGLNPVVLNAVAEGRLQALWVYGAAPWILRRIAVGSGVEPFADPEAPRPPRLRQVAGVALGLGVVAAVTPLGALVLLVVVLLIGAVIALSGDRRGGGAMVVMGLGGAAMALPVMLPWLVAALSRGDAATLTGLWVGRGAMPSATELITGSVGPVEVGLFGWGLLVAAGYALAAGRSWRLRWALAGWALALTSWATTILLAADGMLAGAGAELFLVPGALGLALSVAMGALAFEHDVIGSDFGLPQVLSGVAVVALLIALVPVGVAAVDGRWYQPEGGFGRVLELVDDGDSSRTVWIGDPDVLPIAGWPLDAMAGLSAGTSIGVDPLVTQRYRLDGGEGIATLRAAIDAALRGQTSRLGRLLAPMGVQNVVVIDRPAPQPFAVREVPVPEGALAAFREQLDLTEVELNPGLVLFQVDGPWPLRSDISELELPDRGDVALRDETQVALERPPAVFGTGTGTRFTAELDADRQIAQAETADEGWSLSVDGQRAARAAVRLAAAVDDRGWGSCGAHVVHAGDRSSAAGGAGRSADRVGAVAGTAPPHRRAGIATSTCGPGRAAGGARPRRRGAHPGPRPWRPRDGRRCRGRPRRR